MTKTCEKTTNAQKSGAVDFVQMMEAMRHHYKNVHAVGYSLPSHTIYLAQKEELPEAANQENKKFEGETDSFTQDQKDTIDSSSQKYIDTKDADEFKKKMNAEREGAQDKAKKNIDSYYDKMIDIGVKNPDSQNAILKVAKGVSDFFNGLLSEIIGFVQELVETIAKIFQKVIDEISGFFNDVGDSIGGFFGDLFGLSVAAEAKP